MLPWKWAASGRPRGQPQNRPGAGPRGRAPREGRFVVCGDAATVTSLNPGPQEPRCHCARPFTRVLLLPRLHQAAGERRHGVQLPQHGAGQKERLWAESGQSWQPEGAAGVPARRSSARMPAWSAGGPRSGLNPSSRMLGPGKALPRSRSGRLAREGYTRPRSGRLARAGVPRACPCRCRPAASLPGAVRPVPQGQPWAQHGHHRQPSVVLQSCKGRETWGAGLRPLPLAVPQLASCQRAHPLRGREDKLQNIHATGTGL